MSFSASRLVCVFLDRWSTLAWAAVASALSIIGEVLYTELAFVCPCRPYGYNDLAACVAVLVPCVLLFVGGCLLQGDTWRLLRGCCQYSCGKNAAERDAESGAARAASSGARRENCRVGEAVLVMLFRASVAPLSWVVAALLSGVYFACGQSEYISRWQYSSLVNLSYQEFQQLLHNIPCNNIVLLDKLSVPQQVNIRAEVLASLHAESQLIGLGLLLAVALAAVLIVSIVRCMSRASEREASFGARYRAAESAALADEVDALARSLAEERSRALLLGVRAAWETPDDERRRREVESLWRELSGVRHGLRDGGGVQGALHKYASHGGVELTEYEDADTVYAN